MAVLTADDLLVGPRGRGLCMSVAHLLNEAVLSALHAGDAAGRDGLIGALQAVDPAPAHVA